ncbi:MAG: cytidylate kinase [Chloroflexi bacterium]|nr:cytidylate kinase [Chloroflexota bacterium]MBK90371.1 cytidylate kinase [Chloroflexota bacterium]|tara:strand:+ start:10378 stop:11022 length:645 start_codon:yes stop_codon:yes gene_type:complete
MAYKSIAIDGPAASGKSAVGRLLAEKLSYDFLDTGIMYRAVTYIIQEFQIEPVKASKLFFESKLVIDFSNLNNKIIYQDQDISDFLFTDKIDSEVSGFSKIKSVRENLVFEQKKISNSTNIVMVGRDIGTKVLQNSNLKIYLDASIDVRALRRSKDVENLSKNEVKIMLESRDVIDKNRSNSPLVIDRNASVINTDNLTIDQVVSNILNLYKYE